MTRCRIMKLRPLSVVCPLPLHRFGASTHAQKPELVPYSITLHCNAPEASEAFLPPGENYRRGGSGAASPVCSDTYLQSVPCSGVIMLRRKTLDEYNAPCYTLWEWISCCEGVANGREDRVPSVRCSMCGKRRRPNVGRRDSGRFLLGPRVPSWVSLSPLSP